MEIPKTAKEIVLSLPIRFRKEKAQEENYESTVHLQLSEDKQDKGGDFTVSIKEGNVVVEEGLHGVPACVAKMKSSLYVEMEWDKSSPQIAFMMGRITASNVMELIKFIGMFRNMKRQYGG